MVLVENKDFTARGYVAPTVYLKADRYISNYNYYGSMEAAVNKLLFLNNQGGANVPPVGIQAFTDNGKAQTFATNVDFFVFVGGKWTLAGYSWIRSNITSSSFPWCIIKFQSVTGAGPYYAILDKYYFGISATVINSTDAAKVAELDQFWREVQTLKYRYNSFVGFLNELSKRELNTVEQRIYNEGLLMLNNLSNQLQQIRGIYIQFQEGGKIGLPVLVIIALIAIVAGATAWSISSIASEKERTKRINDSFELQKWVASKQLEVAQQAKAGQISQQSANAINDTLGTAAKVAAKVADNAAKDPGLLGNVATVAKWGVIGYLAYLFVSTNKKRVNA